MMKPGHWKFGIFYYNKDDKRLFPPKPNPGMGSTINFANPKSVRAFMVMIAFFAFIVIMIEKNNS